MYRSRKYSSKNEIVHTSSLSSGNASIQRPTSPVVVTEQSYYTSEPIAFNKDEVIDLQAPIQSKNDLTIESMSAVIAAAVQMSSAGGAPSSLSLGNASILQSSPTENMKRRLSTRFFSNPWKKTSAPTSPSNSLPATPGLEPSSPFDSTSSITIMDDDNSSQGSPRNSSGSGIPDDGRDELLYRGIQIKEIKTTLKTLVISDQARYPMPEVKLERPGFARINY